MKPQRIIIHTENFELSVHDFWRVQAGIKEYCRLRPKSNPNRLTIRFSLKGEMFIYNDPKKMNDLIICEEVSRSLTRGQR